MRIIAGHLKGSPIQQRHGSRTHPMSEKIRGALFNTLGDVEDLTVLDAFAGTGAIGFEAVSRGAKTVVCIDEDARACQSIRETAKQLGITQQLHLFEMKGMAWSSTRLSELFDIVILDPPHDNVQIELLNQLACHTKKNGVLVACLPEGVRFDLENFELIREKTYGNAQLVFYRRAS